ncbi:MULTISPECIES: enoyl-CoA hydratase/isomerase family protein [Burkholderia]|uniref:enoyl-CoA hydratase/isomerase family protein n=1 Tax=Burkholderia TaxID=32008 RepID=UPI0007543377|nr:MULTISPECIES: enoyl-CoA hydratase/isomerase family protein [Burkholderia]AOJ70779.1 enoyl-CoA hydratase [Burkholderia savannae]KVG46731.1 enoyl-CoA hydratase [Burkholderia sp. MSMB0265]KVG87431.1 enoyl-CoA hydratase [Burkholderia sp. MSMB2040]KVG92298.1 enoyl-CoA hydratase [Burkholderia sp. MSMB2041]KVH02469.1 enoyl-CoA hydratase [Burkholderia sp. MSMB2042]
MKHLQIERSGRVLTVSFDNPPLNFLTMAMMREFKRTLDDIARDASIGAVVVTSARPGVFLTHFDVGEIKAIAQGLSIAVPPAVTGAMMRIESACSRVPGVRRLIERTPLAGVAQMNLFHEVTARMRAMDKVFIAAVNGRAMGGGCEIALACDLRLMADGSVDGGQILAQPEIFIGLLPGGGGTQMLARSVGIARALELCLDGRLLSPREAFELGLVNRVVPGERLRDETMALAERLARRASHSVRAIKRAIYDGASLPFRDGMAVEKAGFLSAATQGRTRHAMAAYADHVSSLIEDGEDISVDQLRTWIDGVAVDFSR